MERVSTQCVAFRMAK